MPELGIDLSDRRPQLFTREVAEQEGLANSLALCSWGFSGWLASAVPHFTADATPRLTRALSSGEGSRSGTQVKRTRTPRPFKLMLLKNRASVSAVFSHVFRACYECFGLRSSA